MARPFLHGAYTVQAVVLSDDTLAKGDFPYKRFFIHRNGYLIFQQNDDRMRDYRLTYDTSNRLLLAEDYQQNRVAINYRVEVNDSLLVLDYSLNEKPVTVTGKADNWKNLPLMQDRFHWIVK
ncbi:MAG: hypothetical protein IPM85_15680 [Chitinophagaceae bacterium]|nr:hypothetical protein [Chitinophagaceae bacterium]